jgi:hypothetical protein
MADEFFIVNHPNGWAAKRPDAERSSFVEPTQEATIADVRESFPNAILHVQDRHGKFRRLTPWDPD